MMKYYNKLKNETVFVWVFVKGELVSREDKEYKELLAGIYAKERSLFINRKGEIITGKEFGHDIY
jgi:hypothetical protein